MGRHPQLDWGSSNIRYRISGNGNSYHWIPDLVGNDEIVNGTLIKIKERAVLSILAKYT
jgi:hypothetical protein